MDFVSLPIRRESRHYNNEIIKALFINKIVQNVKK